MTPPAARRRSQFIDAVIDDYAAVRSTPPDAHQLELQRIALETTGGAAGMQVGDDQAVLMECWSGPWVPRARWRSARSAAIRLWPWREGWVPAGACCAVTSARSGPRLPARRGRKPASPAGSSCGCGPGLETLRALPPGEQFDFAFIDADKTGYAQYYEEVLARLRPGGLILLDNTLQGGHVVGDLPDDEGVAAIRSLNDAIAGDPRVKVVSFPSAMASVRAETR